MRGFEVWPLQGWLRFQRRSSACRKLSVSASGIPPFRALQGAVTVQNFHRDAHATTTQASRNQAAGGTASTQFRSMMQSMDPEVRLLVISQLLVIVVPVGLLFLLWIRMLGWDRRRS